MACANALTSKQVAKVAPANFSGLAERGKAFGNQYLATTGPVRTCRRLARADEVIE
jgi:hypothetical protein